MATFKNTIINDTTYIQPPCGTTSQRTAVYTNIIRWTNTGSQSYSVLAGVTPTLTNTSWTCPTGVTQVEVLVVAGGGGGGSQHGGGGGAGGLIYNSAYTVVPGNSYTVTVGAGGAGGTTSGNAGSNGSDSVFAAITATGGGGGGGWVNGPNGASSVGRSGGSGGGGCLIAVGGAGTAGQGNDGGRAWGGTGGANSAINGYPNGGAGGGGAGGAGTSLNWGMYISGAGGPGLNFNISGTPAWYAGGGSGGSHSPNLPAGATLGGGGVGGLGNNASPTGDGGAGTASTGGGGGGSGASNAVGGAGGSGVVIIRYVVASDNTDPRGLLRYNTDLNDIEVYENSYTGWVPQDPNRNFAGHNLFLTSSLSSFSTGQNLNVTASAIRDPFGGTNSYYLQENTTSNTSHSCYLQRTGTAGVPMTFSIFVKADGNGRNVGLYVDGITNGIGYVSINLTTGVSTVISSQSGLISYGSQDYGNGWWRCWITGQTSAPGSYYFHVDTVLGGTSTYVGTVGYGIYAFGPQMEQASSPGPYVVTAGVPSPVPTVLNGYRTHAYTTTGTSGFSPAVTGTVEVLVVAGGGGGGANHAGGGGAGGVLYVGEYQVISGQQYTVTVGAGGAVGPSYSTAQGRNGDNSVFGTLVAAGGGGAGNRRDSGTAGIEYGLWGGSGGGGGGQGSDDNTINWGGAGTLGQGYPGGTGSFHTGAGGGGAGGPGGTTNASAGASNTTVRPGNGGHGVYFPQFAHIGGYPAGWFGGGGAGNAHSTGQSFPATPGWGGGGWPEGYVASGNESVNGRANTGGGGGGSCGSGSSGGGNGGSGIVIVRYRYI
jgi:hypothetical protein